MLITIDNLASRYHCLPSQVLAQATTFDLRVCEVATEWINRRNNPDLAKEPKKPELTQQQMKDMITRVRKKND